MSFNIFSHILFCSFEVLNNCNKMKVCMVQKSVPSYSRAMLTLFVHELNREVSLILQKIVGR